MMEPKKFNLWHRISAVVALIVSAVTYLLTIEPSASFWDCGEFIASSYKLEVGHPPGNPVFQLIARLFTMFGDNMHAAVLVNAMSALLSALTIFLLYLTIVWFVRRIVKPDAEGRYSVFQAITIIGSGLTGALAYCFSDTFWFSAVEGEVYAMSSFFTAIVFWLMTMWYDRSEEPHADRWIVLIAFLMGLSIGVHLLNLLSIPALVFLFYFRKREDKPFTIKELFKIFAVGVLILAIILYVIIPLFPKIAAYVDLFFVNVLSLPYNVGAAFFVLAVIALCFWGLFRTLSKGKVFLNTALLCLTTVILGFSLFGVVVIRSVAKTPTNEYQPDNAFTLVRYLSREQYGKSPLIYGQYFDAPYDIKEGKYWAPLDGKYKHVDSPAEADYRPEGKMLFPRMWNSSQEAIGFYEQYTGGKGKTIPGSSHKKPTMGANLWYFLDFQMNWMYWRYFMWNFVGRQNEIHSPTPGNLFHGNWESGIAFLDRARLGDQSDAPSILKDNKGKNHYFFLPLILGLLGLFLQYGRDKRGCWINFLMFFMTGIAIVIYLNQPPYQVRERDYAYAGSFYFFSVWIGMGVAAIISAVTEALKGKEYKTVACAVCLLCLGVPALMAQQNWDDHDRSNRRTAAELGSNYLNSVGSNGILVTHGDNDTFPLWYAQEVENVRQDVRIVNTSLLGTDWHIDQMTYACNNSAPLALGVPHEQYLYGRNDFIPINDTRNQEMMISDVMKLFRHPDVKLALASGRRVDYIASRKIVVPVNKENVIKYGLLDEKYADKILDSIVLTIPQGKEYISKPELFILDLLSNYQWDRPINFLSYGGDLNIGIKDYMMYLGYSCQLVPFKNRPTSSEPGFVDAARLYSMMRKSYNWDNLSRDDYFIDYQNMYTFLGVVSNRNLFVTVANLLLKEGYEDLAKEMIIKCEEVMGEYPLETIPIGFSANDYVIINEIMYLFTFSEKEKALELATGLGNELLAAAKFYLEFYDLSQSEFKTVCNYLYYLSDILKTYGEGELASNYIETLNNLASEAGMIQ